jgi:hypothetical protein
VVAYLGALTAGQESGWATLGRRLDGKDRPPPTLFDPLRRDEPADDEPVVVNLKRVRLERLRGFGDVWLALGLWRLLGLDGLLARRMGDAPRTVLEEFARIQSGDVVLPTRTADGRPRRTVRLRCVTAPDEGQKVLLSRLGLTLPQRLRRMDEITQM